MYLGSFSITHDGCWGSETSKILASKDLCLKVILEKISENSYELMAFCRKDQEKLPSVAEINFTMRTLNNFPTVQKCKLVNQNLALLKLSVVDAVGEEGIIRSISEIKGVGLLPLYGTWIFENNIEKYWMYFENMDAFSTAIGFLDNNNKINIIDKDFINIFDNPQICHGFPNYLNTAIEIFDIDGNIIKDIISPIEEYIINSVHSQVINETELSQIMLKVEEGEINGNWDYLGLRLLMEIIKMFLGNIC